MMTIMNKMYKLLEYEKVLQQLKDFALSEKVKQKIEKLEPYLSESEVGVHIVETTEARSMIEGFGTPPLSRMEELEKSMSLLGKGTFLMPEQLELVAQFLNSCKRMKLYLKKAEYTGYAIAFSGNSFYDLTEIEERISSCIRGSQVDDRASAKLADIRRKISVNGDHIKSKLDSLLKNNKAFFSESFVSIRNGHYTLPVKKECRNQVKGTVIDMSQSGSTYFIEPASVSKFRDELNLLLIEEDNEIRRILYELTALVEENKSCIHINIETMESLDFVFAKAKLSISMKAVPPVTCLERKIEIVGGRHPLMRPETVVPLDFKCGGEVQGVVITGPNTGGKTVALKAIGLMSLMAQSGLHIPAQSGVFSLNSYILCDIGDGQSISENLSTFSSHMSNIIQILALADRQSLVLLDELGSGTDPQEGMGLAVAILEELVQKGCTLVATTHYPEVKEYAKITPGLVNARMAFDSESLQPLYRMEIGEAGESCALLIAKRLGLPDKMISRAHSAAYSREPLSKDAGNLPNTSANVNNSSTGASRAGGDTSSLPRPVIYPTRTIKAAEPPKSAEIPRSQRFNLGDSVRVYPQKSIGIVYQRANEKGEVGVQIQKQKYLINHKRLQLHVAASELYPDDYDFSIVFDSVENRKKRHLMEKGHQPNLTIE